MRIKKIDPSLKHTKVVPLDISRKDITSLKGFFEYISKASAVATTRLHVGIVAALMGKKVYVIYGGALDYKRKGIVDYSLRRYSNVIPLENK